MSYPLNMNHVYYHSDPVRLFNFLRKLYQLTPYYHEYYPPSSDKFILSNAYNFDISDNSFFLYTLDHQIISITSNYNNGENIVRPPLGHCLNMYVGLNYTPTDDLITLCDELSPQYIIDYYQNSKLAIQSIWRDFQLDELFNE